MERTWGDCTLRSWLNGEFLDVAFGDEERMQIIQVTNTTENAPDTQDSVFLLSLDELNAYFPDEESRIAEATEYAVGQGGRVSRETGMTYWWLRTKATVGDAALMVRYDGAVNDSGIPWKWRSTLCARLSGCMRNNLGKEDIAKHIKMSWPSEPAHFV